MRVSQASERDDDVAWGELIRGELEGWHPRRRRLEIVTPAARRRANWPVAVALALAVALAFGVATTRSVDPRHWWAEASTAVQQFVQPPPSGRGEATPVKAEPAASRSGLPAADATPGASPASPSSGGGQNGSAVDVSIKSGPGAGDTRQGVNVSNDPRGAGGMSGEIGEGPFHAGGTIDGRGVRGCLGVYDAVAGQNICGSVNLPVTLPVPPLPAPVVPNAAPSPSP